MYSVMTTADRLSSLQLITESYTVFAGLQTLANGYNGMDDDGLPEQRGLSLGRDSQ